MYFYSSSFYIVSVVSILYVAHVFCNKTAENLVSIPLTLTKSPFHRMLEVGTIPKQFFDIANKTNDTLSLYKFLDTEFYATVGVGEPAQDVNIVFDTTWSDSWVISSKCSWTCIPCLLKSKYDNDKSTSFIDKMSTFNISLAGGSLDGFLAEDTIYFPHINITNQTFGAGTRLPWSYLFSPSSGVFGLSLSRNSIFKDFPLIFNLIRKNKNIKPIFSIYMNRSPTTPHGGAILFGGINDKYVNGTITYLQVMDSFYWEFQMDSIEIVYSKHKGEILCPNKCFAMADTSTTVILGPKEDVDKINTRIGATNFMFGKYLVPCGKIDILPHISFILGARNFTLNGNDYVQKISYSGFQICVSSFMPSGMAAPYNTTWALGGAFLAKFYTIFDLGNRRIGFSTRKGGL